MIKGCDEEDRAESALQRAAVWCEAVQEYVNDLWLPSRGFEGIFPDRVSRERCVSAVRIAGSVEGRLIAAI